MRLCMSKPSHGISRQAVICLRLAVMRMKVRHYEANFKQALAMLKRHGVKEIATYRRHHRTMVPIEPPVVDADNVY